MRESCLEDASLSTADRQRVGRDERIAGRLLGEDSHFSTAVVFIAFSLPVLCVTGQMHFAIQHMVQITRGY